jgi:hypothetical protein
MIINVPKDKYPFYYEYRKLGKDLTEEGREYLSRFQTHVNEEISDILDEGFYRRMDLGGDEGIHKIN